MAQSISVNGVWPATLTPFTPDGLVDSTALGAHIGAIAATPGVTAVVVNGHAGETTSLNALERAEVVRTAVSVAGQVPVVAGIVAEDPRSACELARDAERAGASALLLFPPALFANSATLRPQMARAFVTAVAAASTLPIVLFQLSQSSGQAFSPALIAEIVAEVPQVIGVKDGSDSPALYEDVLQLLAQAPRPVGMLTSNNSWLMASLSYGGDGILSGLGSVAAPQLVELLSAMQSGDLAAARRINARLQPLCRVFYRAPYCDVHNRMKAALHLLGLLDNPAPRPPLLPLSDAEIDGIRLALQQAQLLPRQDIA